MIDFKNKQIRTDLSVILSYVILTILMTYPLILSMDSSVPNDKGDSLHNTWILSWTVHSLLTDPSNLFNSNIYYPLKNTFSFSEVQLTNSLLAMPILILSGNPILAHNIVLILSFILSGLGVYYLVRYLTKNNLAGFISGIIFAFFPFKFAHLTHLQLLSTQWIPFSILFLHKYFEKRSKKNLILFFLFFSLQVITIGYLTLFLLLIVFIYILYLFIFKRKILIQGITENSYLIVGLTILLVSITSFFYLPYFTSYEYGFKRSLGELDFYGADIINYFSTPGLNYLYGKILIKNASHEGITALFPGFISIILMSIGIIKFINDSNLRVRTGFVTNKNELFYIIIMCVGFLMSLGPFIHFAGKIIMPGPYMLFYYFPGFNGIRFIPAFVVLVMLGISVLSGFGFEYLIEKIKYKKDIYKKILFILLISGILFEYVSIPIPTPHIATGAEVPEVYKWLSNDSGDYAILELPIPINTQKYYMDQFDYMYFSTYHWKKLVNGISGYFPSYHYMLLNELQFFPSERSIRILEEIKVKYILIHGDRMEISEMNALLTNVTYRKDLVIKEKFGSDYIYEINK